MFDNDILKVSFQLILTSGNGFSALHAHDCVSKNSSASEHSSTNEGNWDYPEWVNRNFRLFKPFLRLFSGFWAFDCPKTTSG